MTTNSTSDERERQLPDHFICIAPKERSVVAAYLLNPDSDQSGLGSAHLHLCASCTEMVRAAATSMRSLCVEKVKAMREGWQSRLDNADEFSAVETVMSSRTYAADQIVTELQSLTLDQVEQKQ